MEENGGQGEEDSVCSRAPLICNCRTVRAGETEEERTPGIERRQGFPFKHTMTLHGSKKVCISTVALVKYEVLFFLHGTNEHMGGNLIRLQPKHCVRLV